MKAFRIWLFAVALGAVALTPSCRLFHRSAKAKPPATPPAVTQPAPEPEPDSEPAKVQDVMLPDPPQLAPQPGADTHPPPVAREPLPPAPAKGRRRARNEMPAQPAPPPQAATDAAAPAPQPVPELEQILSPEEQAAYNDEIDRYIGRAQKTIAQLNGKPLNSEQKVYLERIRAFIDQATVARKADLFRAKNLAERASVLADDLFKSVQ